MAKNTRVRSQKTNKQSKVPNLFGRRFGRPAMFAAAFALVGVVTLIASFAATPTGQIVNKQNNECLENFFNRQLNTNFISTYPCDSNNQAQKWALASDSSIRTKDNFCLDVPNATKRSGARVWLWQCNGSAAQKWQIQSSGTIKNPNSGLCLEMTATDTFLGGPNLLLQTCNSSNKRQIWTVPTSSVPIPIPTPPPSNPPPPTTTPSGAVDIKQGCLNSNPNIANGTTVRSGYPNNSNTGPAVGGYSETKLPVATNGDGWTLSGSKLTITKNGAVLNAVYHNGIIEVNADNVTIKNSVICGVGSILVRNNGQNLLVENSILRGEQGAGTINANTGEPCAATIGYANYTARRNEISGCADGVKLGHRVEVYDSWFHSSYTNRFGGGAGTHNDTTQKNDETPLTSLVFNGNAAYQDACTSNRHFQLKSKTGQSAQSIVIENNFFYGITGVNMDGFRTTIGRMDGNFFAGSNTQGPFNHGSLYAGEGMNTITRQNNVYESGQPANDNPTAYQCVSG